MKLNAKQLRHLPANGVASQLATGPRRPIYFILENIYDTYNIGGLFRLADAINAEKIFLCGEMETPPNSKIAKASIGTDKIVPWEYRRSVKEAITDLNLKFKIKNLKLNCVAVEQAKTSLPYQQAQYQLPLALIFGNETFGILPKTLKLADQIVEIPLFGVNRSLNVIVSAAIVSYWTLFVLKLTNN